MILYWVYSETGTIAETWPFIAGSSSTKFGSLFWSICISAHDLSKSYILAFQWFWKGHRYGKLTCLHKQRQCGYCRVVDKRLGSVGRFVLVGSIWVVGNLGSLSKRVNHFLLEFRPGANFEPRLYSCYPLCRTNSGESLLVPICRFLLVTLFIGLRLGRSKKV